METILFYNFAISVKSLQNKKLEKKKKRLAGTERSSLGGSTLLGILLLSEGQGRVYLPPIQI